MKFSYMSLKSFCFACLTMVVLSSRILYAYVSSSDEENYRNGRDESNWRNWNSQEYYDSRDMTRGENKYYTNGRWPYYWGDYNRYNPSPYTNYGYSKKNYYWQYNSSGYNYNYRNSTPYTEYPQRSENGKY